MGGRPCTVAMKFCVEVKSGIPMESVIACTIVIVVMNVDACDASEHCGASGEYAHTSARSVWPLAVFTLTAPWPHTVSVRRRGFPGSGSTTACQRSSSPKPRSMRSSSRLSRGALRRRPGGRRRTKKLSSGAVLAAVAVVARRLCASKATSSKSM